MRTTVERLDQTATIVQSALADLHLPDGWRLRQTPGHLDATWHGPDGRWARFSLRFVADRGPRTASSGPAPGGGTVLVTFVCDVADAETLGRANDLLGPLTAALAGGP